LYRPLSEWKEFNSLLVSQIFAHRPPDPQRPCISPSIRRESGGGEGWGKGSKIELDVFHLEGRGLLGWTPILVVEMTLQLGQEFWVLRNRDRDRGEVGQREQPRGESRSDQTLALIGFEPSSP
jgi:hypothetical protein